MNSRCPLPKRADRVPKPIAPNPWRRGRRRSGVHLADPAQYSDGDGTPSPNPGRTTEREAHRPTPALAGQVTGLFANGACADRACRALGALGYGRDAIKLLMTHETRSRFSDVESDHAVDSDGHREIIRHEKWEGHGVAGGAGHVFEHQACNPRVPGISADVSVVCVGHDAQVEAAPVVRLADALAGSGIPRERIAEYETALRAGAILMRVITRSEADARVIEAEWGEAHRAQKVKS